MLPPRPSSYAPYAPTSQTQVAPTLSKPSPELYSHGSSQLRSRLLGQDEQNVMLALGLVRTASRALLGLEPKLLRAAELLSRFESAREAAARMELGKIYDELSRTVASAVFEGRPIFESASTVFDVDDARRKGESLMVTLPDFQSLLHGEDGLEHFLSRARIRFEVERMSSALRTFVTDGKTMLNEADRQLSVLLTHFHRQRRENPALVAPQDLVQTATRLSERVQSAGNAALAAQGELSTRASSLVLSDRPPR
jgi:hypothetical protein